jgi:hypothetical protein
MLSKPDIAKKFKKEKGITSRALGEQYDNTRNCQSFYSGDSMDYQDKMGFTDNKGQKKRALVKFNKVKPNVDAVGGFMAQNRRNANYVARVKDSQAQMLYSRNTNALKDYIREKANSDQIETQQNFDMLINGYGAVATDISYVEGSFSTTAGGDILKQRLDPLCVGWDGSAKDKNLTDARFTYYWEEYDIEDALSLFEGSEEDDFETIKEKNDTESGYEYYPYGGRYDKIRYQDTVEWADKEAQKVRVYQYQWFEYETYYRADSPLYQVNDPIAAMRVQMELDAIKAEQDVGYGDLFEFDPRAKVLTFDDKTKALLVKAFGKHIKCVPFKRKAYYTAVLSGDHVFTAFRSISQMGFSIKFKTGGYNATSKIWVGMVNSMMEPSKYYNKALTEFMFTIASNSKGGVMIENDAVEDVADFEAKWAKTDAVITMRSGALSAGKVQEKARAAVPTGLESLIHLSDAAIADTSGVDRSFLGSSESKQETGVLFKRRIRQVISTMAMYFDAETLYLKESARMDLDFMRIWAQNHEGEQFEIIGGDGSVETADIAQDQLMAEYGISIQEASQTPEDKQETGEVLSSFADKFLAAGDPSTAKAIYGEAIQFLPIDGDVRQRLSQALQPQQQIDRQAVAQMQQELELLKSQVTQAEVEYKKSQSAKNISDIHLNEANIKDKTEQANQRKVQNVKTLEESQKIESETMMIRKEIKQPQPTGA